MGYLNKITWDDDNGQRSYSLLSFVLLKHGSVLEKSVCFLWIKTFQSQD